MISYHNKVQAPTERTTVMRQRQRARYDREAVHAILDEGVVAHVAVVAGHGPLVLPTAYVRIGDEVLVHGARANGLLRLLAAGASASVTITLVDGLVLARSAFHHSVNYRSVVVFARGRAVTDPHAKAAALTRLLEHLAPGRAAEVRPPSP